MVSDSDFLTSENESSISIAKDRALFEVIDPFSEELARLDALDFNEQIYREKGNQTSFGEDKQNEREQIERSGILGALAEGGITNEHVTYRAQALKLQELKKKQVSMDALSQGNRHYDDERISAKLSDEIETLESAQSDLRVQLSQPNAVDVPQSTEEDPAS